MFHSRSTCLKDFFLLTITLADYVWLNIKRKLFFLFVGLRFCQNKSIVLQHDYQNSSLTDTGTMFFNAMT